MIVRVLARVLSRQRRVRYHPQYYDTRTITSNTDERGRRGYSTHRILDNKDSHVKEEDEYRKLNSVEHILLRPDTYIGSTMQTEEEIWLVDDSNTFSRQLASFSPGLIKIVDEILVNAADNKQRDERMDEIRIDIDESTGQISVWNNGRSLPIKRVNQGDPNSDYIPTLVFGSLYTSSNYDDERQRLVGGRNGFGAKLANIYSTRFSVHTASTETRMEFEQEWKDNMSSCSIPKISVQKDGEVVDFTLIHFTPDYRRFGCSGLSSDAMGVLRRRVFELAATLKGVRVFLNGKFIQIDGLRGYASRCMADKEGEDSTVVYYNKENCRWEVAFGLLRVDEPEDAQSISFVNNCATTKGGKHVAYVWDRTLSILRPWIEMKVKKVVKPAMIKRRLSIFLSCLIDNPTFDSQMKETLLTRTSDFGSEFILDAKSLIGWAERVGLDEVIRKDLTLKRIVGSDRPSSSNMVMLDKLEDASLAGRKSSHRCSLLLTEGDSAKALAMSGLQIVGRERFGVYPLRGKLTNISEMERDKALAVPEVAALTTILGLRPGVDYSIPEERCKLRYDRIILLTDQDEDGSHIKGLVMNIFRCLWPQLLRTTPSFLTALDTPLIKARKGSITRSFYSRRDFDDWIRSQNSMDRWKVKYYKGLGTSTAEEAKEYFRDLEQQLVHYVWREDKDYSSMETAFGRNMSSERKRWILAGEEKDDYSMTSSVSNKKIEMSFSEFIDSEMRIFAKQDLKRSIPNVMDGLKPSQRKILYVCLKMGPNKQEKVAQLAAHVAHSTAYHHGEQSLVRAIVKMGADYVGSSNIPLLKGIGQFGTRHSGGDDAASARYIYAALSPMTRLLFPVLDDELLERTMEEGEEVEPVWYCPILPLVLINGAEGIATGWSTTVHPRDPARIVDKVIRMIDDIAEPSEEMLPYYAGFNGSISEDSAGRIRCEGRWKWEENSEKPHSRTLIIDELPVGVWTTAYKQRLLAPMIIGGQIRRLLEAHSDDRVRFEIDLSGKMTERMRKNVGSVQKAFKLTTTSNAGNMVLFTSEGRLKTYQSVDEIVRDHFTVRKCIYVRRLVAQGKQMEERLEKERNEHIFVSAFLQGRLEGSSNEHRRLRALEMGCREDLVENLLDLPLSKLNHEECFRLEEKIQRNVADLEKHGNRMWQDVWKEELHLFEEEWKKELLRKRGK